MSNRDSAFIDFLSGRMDYEYIVKPSGDVTATHATNDSSPKTPVSSAQYSKA
jgi:hypothetical protein